MRLLISREVVDEIIAFSMQWGKGAPVFEDLKIIVPTPILSLKFYQPEKYSRLIVCYLDFGDDVGFFFEDVLSAVEGGRIQIHTSFEHSIETNDVLRRNDEYVHEVLDFFAKNSNLLTTLPPTWFEKAVEVSDAAIRKHFPDMADLDREKKQALFDSWQQHSQ